MRVLVVVAGITLGLSGCIGGGIIHRAPAGNETAEEGDASAVEQAPWQLNGTAGARDDAGRAGKDGSGGKGPSKDGSGGGGQGGSGGSGGSDPDPGENGTEPGDNETTLDGITGQAPTEGAASADDVLTGAEDTIEEGSQTNTPKEPIEDPDDVNVGVPVSGGTGVSGTPKSIPDTDTTMLA